MNSVPMYCVNISSPDTVVAHTCQKQMLLLLIFFLQTYSMTRKTITSGHHEIDSAISSSSNSFCLKQRVVATENVIRSKTLTAQ